MAKGVSVVKLNLPKEIENQIILSEQKEKQE